MSTRSTRDQPFCWQEKKILRLIQSHFKKSSLTKMLMLYQTVTWMDSDFNGKDIKFYTKTISTYSGLSIEFIPTGLSWLEKHKVLNRVEETNNGRYKGKHLVFTPELVEEEEIPRKTVVGKTVNGKTVVGKDDTSEDSSLLEDSIYKEDNKHTVDLKKSTKEVIAIEIIKSLNKQTKRSFSIAAKGRGSDNVKMLITLLNKGYTKDEVLLMIRFKVFEWGWDDDMKSYLRPETLFKSKAGIYIEAAKEAFKNKEITKAILTKKKKKEDVKNGKTYNPPTLLYSAPKVNALKTY